MHLDWYFDYVSPFAYLQFALHPDLMQRPDSTLCPVLFAGFLNEWGHKGPAEIPPKKIHTFRLVTWQAAKWGVPMRCPPVHPFNPLHALRLTIALGARYDVVKTIFEFIWRDGRSITDEWQALLALLHVDNAEVLLSDEKVKAALRANGTQAIRAGVFGVPSLVAGKEVFWGEDATDMLRDYLANSALFDTAEMKRIAALPAGASRI
ncbi:MAG: 2-hydroxychromene-2-carboxylate isomerase [Betaproteobacteria bacterium]|nr:2-hydroxychromene-2-carboxylate isomerase [Betaproteobacteria bacterium]